jgi:hypothetical protein
MYFNSVRAGVNISALGDESRKEIKTHRTVIIKTSGILTNLEWKKIFGKRKL